jgi:DNA-binding MarR family transcriptional regulator
VKDKCIVAKINAICNISDKYAIKRINEERLPILRNHIPLFLILAGDGTPLLFNEIANIWEISKSSLSDIILKYENQGLIKKCSCSEDKRSVYISLTPEAVIIKEKLYEIEDEFLKLLLNNFDEDQRNTFEKDIDKALSNLERLL